MDIEMVVEIPKGSRNKYQADEHGVIWLDRMLFTATEYPEDYGYIPETLAADGDPLDVMMLHSGPTFPGCHIVGRPVGLFLMRDEGGVDAKILSVPSHDPRADGQTDLEDIPAHILNEIRHFFTIYKSIEPGTFSEITGWKGREEAETAIGQCRDRWKPTR